MKIYERAIRLLERVNSLPANFFYRYSSHIFSIKMRVFSFLLPLFLLLSCHSEIEPLKIPTHTILDYADPFVGTGGHGHTYPGVCQPFGMIQPSPDTRLTGWDGCSAYHFTDSKVYGFSHTHLSGTGVSDYGDLLLMPSTSSFHLDKETLASAFRKEKEVAYPSYYSTYLEDEKIKVELTASNRSAFHRYSTEKARGMWIALDLRHRDNVLDAGVQLLNDSTLLGYRISKEWAEEQHFYFALKLSEAIEEVRYAKKDNGEIDSLRLGILFNAKPKELLVKVGMSPVSSEGALRNLSEEIPDWDWNGLSEASKIEWIDQLSKIEIKASDEVKQNFYSALYHSSIVPNNFTDVDGSYRATDKSIQKAEGYRQYTIFSLWDTYRSLHPLYTLIEPERNADFVKSMLSMYKYGGSLPVWELAGNYTGCMIGYHTVSVIADAILKEQVDIDEEFALEAMIAIAEEDRLGKQEYEMYGFIPSAKEPESVSKTLEYAYNDWCIAQVAKKINKPAIYERFIKRAQSYKNVFDPESQFMRPKVNNRWISNFDPYEVNFHFTEANAWQYNLYAPHDVEGLISLFGGKEALNNRLDTLFTTSSKTSGREQADITGLIGQYAHGNEPSHHLAYLYNYVGYPAKAQRYIREILEELYRPTPDGLCGNEDCGQMSAWYILSALGLYSLAPGSMAYDLGSPIVEEAKIHLGTGSQLEVIAHNNSKENVYVDRILWNGSPLDRLYIMHKEIAKGGKLEFFMTSEEPSKEDQDLWIPFSSKIEDHLIMPSPALIQGERAFIDSQYVAFNHVSAEAEIYFALDQDSVFRKYEAPFLIRNSRTLRAYAYDASLGKSKEIFAEFKRIPAGRSIQLFSTYANQYSAGGENTMIDYILGGKDYRTGEWQGYQGQDVETIVNLGSLKDIQIVGLNCLQDENAWIFMPASVEYYTSQDGKDFQKLASISTDVSPKKKGVIVKPFLWNGVIQAQYVKVIARSLGECPPYHKGAGNPSWIFVDELIIE